MGFGVWGLGLVIGHWSFRVWGLGFGVWGWSLGDPIFTLSFPCLPCSRKLPLLPLLSPRVGLDWTSKHGDPREPILYGTQNYLAIE
ncbi:MAG: hypothetical protein D6728_17710 [Cyanobacteria bacterium J055]|nr:MAG: hypothetical protein D6728_17710 [Cyanobacteria bacterium J055]